MFLNLFILRSLAMLLIPHVDQGLTKLSHLTQFHLNFVKLRSLSSAMSTFELLLILFLLLDVFAMSFNLVIFIQINPILFIPIDKSMDIFLQVFKTNQNGCSYLLESKL